MVPAISTATGAREAFDTHLATFLRFVAHFREVFGAAAPLRDAGCRQSYKDYVPRYYASLFGPGVRQLTSRHFKWLRRLSAVLCLPQGATILDYGGGYGLDSILLAACGYRVVFYEITPHHVAVCEFLADGWRRRHGELALRTVLRSRQPDVARRDAEDAAAIGDVDAMLLDEVAHHIEPVGSLFDTATRVLRPDGRLFLLEPNFWSLVVQAGFFRVRGFRTLTTQRDDETGVESPYGNERIRPRGRWHRHARAAGLEPAQTLWMVPFFMNAPGAAHSGWRRAVEALPLLRDLAATHLTMEFRRK